MVSPRGLNLNKVSDDNYFRDLATRINITSQARCLARVS